MGETGKQEAFGLTFTVYPIKTMTALCYKLDFLESPCNGSQVLTISSTNLTGDDKLDGINWYVAANNTWQGIIQGHWPYENIPMKFYGELKEKYDFNEIKLKEHKWNYLNCYLSFEKCYKFDKTLLEFVKKNRFRSTTLKILYDYQFINLYQ